MLYHMRKVCDELGVPCAGSIDSESCSAEFSAGDTAFFSLNQAHVY